MDQPEKPTAVPVRRIRRNILFYATAGAFIIAIISAAVTLAPMAWRLWHGAKEDVLQVARAHAESVEQLLEGVQQVTVQFASRSRARDLLLRVEQNPSLASQSRTQLASILRDALASAQEAQGVTRVDREGAVVASVGSAIPPEWWPRKPCLTIQVCTKGPVELEGEFYVVVSAPIRLRDGTPVGADIVLFSAGPLNQILQDRTGLGETAETWLVIHRNGKLVLYGQLTPNAPQCGILPEGAPEYEAVQHLSPSDWARASVITSGESILAHEPVPSANWLFLVRVNKSEVFGEIEQQLGIAAATALALTGLGALMLFLLLRPLAGGLVVNAENLRAEVNARTLQLKEANEQLREATAIQAAVLSSAYNAIIATDRNGTISLFNEAAESLLGYSADEVIGRLSPLVFYKADELERRAERLSEKLERQVRPDLDVLTAMVDAGVSRRQEWTYVRKDGGTVPVLVGVSALTDRTGVQQGFLYVATEITQLKRAREELERLAKTDELTGVYNRRHILDEARVLLAQSRRHHHSLSVLIFDLDHFKNINDTHGHDIGDLVLKTVAQLGQTQLRVEDVFGRLGGEEFVALLPETAREAAYAVADRIRRKIAEHRFSTLAGSLEVTVSIGLATLSAQDADFASILKRADQALYRAKAGGRNKVVAA